MRLTNAEGRELLKQKQPKKSREGNKPTEYNGITYHSKKEADYAAHLDLKVQSGLLKSWRRQVPLKCEIAGYKITTYICDFVALRHDDVEIYIDVKGRKSGGPYQMFQLKKRLVKALLGIDIVEI